MHDNPLELCLVQGKEEREDDLIIVKQVSYLEVNEAMIQKLKKKRRKKKEEKRKIK